ncbi:hypothetical protein M758_UG131500 [Ceratodon purpureus]|nr:hypothetical protein M758_UG131500 [Ceratodon purpureus]
MNVDPGNDRLPDSSQDNYYLVQITPLKGKVNLASFAKEGGYNCVKCDEENITKNEKEAAVDDPVDINEEGSGDTVDKKLTKSDDDNDDDSNSDEGETTPNAGGSLALQSTATGRGQYRPGHLHFVSGFGRPNVAVRGLIISSRNLYTPVQKWKYLNNYPVDSVKDVPKWAVEVGLADNIEDAKNSMKSNQIGKSLEPPKYGGTSNRIHLTSVEPEAEKTKIRRAIWDTHLTFDEFCMQEKIDEDEFGPDEDIYSIRRDCFDLELPSKYMEKEWRMRANRYKEVQRLKQRKKEEATTTAPEQSGE